MINESWCFKFDSDAKRQSMEWRGKNLPLEKEVRLQKIAFQENDEHFFDILLTVHLNMFILILTNLMR